MLIRVVCAIKEKKLHADLENRLSHFDVQLKMLEKKQSPVARAGPELRGCVCGQQIPYPPTH